MSLYGFSVFCYLSNWCGDICPTCTSNHHFDLFAVFVQDDCGTHWWKWPFTLSKQIVFYMWIFILKVLLIHNIVTHTNYTFFVPGLIRLFLPGPLISSGSMKSFIWSLNIMPVELDITPEPKLWEYREYSDNKTEKNSWAAIL